MLDERQKLIKGSLDPAELEKLVRQRFEQNIREGNFSAISNIPYELSRLQQEIDNCTKTMSNLRQEAQKRMSEIARR